jgi:hypothetical protein
VSPVKYELGFYIPEDDILHIHRRENLKSYKTNKVMVGKYTHLSRVVWHCPSPPPVGFTGCL